MRIRIVLEAMGAALLLLPWYIQLLTSSNLPIYHHGLPVTNLVNGFLIDLVGVAILVIGFLVTIEYLPKTVQRILLALFVGVMLLRIVDLAFQVAIATLGLKVIQYQYSWQSTRKEFLVFAVFALSAVAFLLPHIGQAIIRVLRIFVSAFAFSALWIVPQLIHLALIRAPREASASLHPLTSVSGSLNHRIVWILFDELSYDQTFGHKAAGISLPNFNLLRNESVSFSNLSPAGFYTDRIVPSLLLGRPINQIRSTLDSNLSYMDESLGRWMVYDPDATLFAVAQKSGWTTGVDGWYNPYCHVFSSVLDSCSWEPDHVDNLQMEVDGASEDKSALANTTAVWSMLFGKRGDKSARVANAHMLGYSRVMARSHGLIADDKISFVFLHLPIPHPPGIYDRQSHAMRPGGTYLDNLVLSDEALADLMRDIDATSSANRTTVIVSSDHSWRIQMWKYTNWTEEEERASGGRFDERPVLLIHFPGQTAGRNVNSALPELLEHDIIAGMLQGKINSPEDLSILIAQRGY